MADNSLNDQINQTRHASEIRQRTEDRRQSPEEKGKSELAELVAAEIQKATPALLTKIDQAVQQKFAGFTIQAGNGIDVSGSGGDITISVKNLNITGTGIGTCNADGTMNVVITFNANFS